MYVHSLRRAMLLAGLTLGVTLGVAARCEASGSSALHDHSMHTHAAQPAAGYTSKHGRYSVPAVKLRDSHGEDILLVELLAEDRPVMVQFIFTSCATICPILSVIFSNAQSEIAKVGPDYRMISISIDPEYDTPKRLAAYARRYHANANWIFLTGSKSDIGKVMRSFDVLYQGDNKMYHQPYTFLRARSGDSWLRIEGFLTIDELVREYRSTLIQADIALR